MKRLLAADIGGANSRFASFLVRNGQLELQETSWLSTAQAASFDELFELLAASGFGLAPRDAAACVLAVPGAVKDGRYAKPPNIPWEMDLANVADRFGRGPTKLINDFVAQAYACRTSVVEKARLVKPGSPEENGVRAAVGAGTGLGHAALLPDGHGGWAALASENGHAAFPLLGGQEQEFAKLVQAETGMPYAFGDLVVSGLGLRLAHKFLTGQDLEPAQVGAVLDKHPGTVNFFARMYGRAARNYALAVVALGGVFVMGGVAAKNPQLIESASFTEEFVNSPKYGWLLETVPVRLVDDQDSGLWGAAFLARQLAGQDAK